MVVVVALATFIAVVVGLLVVVAFFLAFLVVEACKAVLSHNVLILLARGLSLLVVAFKAIGLDAASIEGYNLKCTSCIYCNEVGRYYLICRVCNLACKNVRFEEEVCVVFGFELYLDRKSVV